MKGGRDPGLVDFEDAGDDGRGVGGGVGLGELTLLLLGLAAGGETGEGVAGLAVVHAPVDAAEEAQGARRSQQAA